MRGDRRRRARRRAARARARGGRVEAGFHLAATSTVGAGDAAPLETFESNVRGTWNLLEALRGGGVEWVVVASSEHAYGPPSGCRSPRPRAARRRALRGVEGRGGHHRPLLLDGLRPAGGDDAFRQRLRRRRSEPLAARAPAVAALLDGGAPVIRSDGSPERDFLHVDDAVDALPRARRRARGRRGARRGVQRGRRRAAPRDRCRLALCELSGSRPVEPDVRGSGTPAGEIDRQWLDSVQARAR